MGIGLNPSGLAKDALIKGIADSYEGNNSGFDDKPVETPKPSEAEITKIRKSEESGYSKDTLEGPRSLSLIKQSPNLYSVEVYCGVNLEVKQLISVEHNFRRNITTIFCFPEKGRELHPGPKKGFVTDLNGRPSSEDVYSIVREYALLAVGHDLGIDEDHFDEILRYSSDNSL